MSFMNLPPLPAVLLNVSLQKNLGLEQAGGYFVHLLQQLLFSQFHSAIATGIIA